MIQVTVFVDPATDHITGFHTYGHRIGMVPSSAEAELLLRSMMIGLKGIAEEYGSQYLRVSTKEV